MDGVILVVRYRSTPKQAILETVENLGRENILGVVFNAVRETGQKYKYYYQYYRRVKE